MGTLLAEAEGPTAGLQGQGSFPAQWPGPGLLMVSGFMFVCLSTGAGYGDRGHIRRPLGSCRMGLISLGEL